MKSEVTCSSTSNMKYTLYYWPIPFRGQYARALMKLKGIEWEEASPMDLRNDGAKRGADGELEAQFMAPPLLYDHDLKVYIPQTPAIVSFLARQLGVAPTDTESMALADACVGNCNDIINELTLNCGAKMWTQESFDAFIAERFPKWLGIMETVATRRGLSASAGFYLGGESITQADTSIWACFALMEKALPALGPLLRSKMPCVMALVDRLGQLEGLKALADSQPTAPYCGGQIEASVREVVAGCAALG